MNICRKCGATMLPASKFCGKCGTAIEAPIKTVCPNCHNEVSGGTLFCTICGTKLGTVAKGDMSTGGSRSVIVTRETQFQCAGNTYQVIVNGNNLGNVAIGKSVSANVMSDTATVEIICTTIMINAKVKLFLRLGENAEVSFKAVWPGTIVPTVKNAEILENTTK